MFKSLTIWRQKLRSEIHHARVSFTSLQKSFSGSLLLFSNCLTCIPDMNLYLTQFSWLILDKHRKFNQTNLKKALMHQNVNSQVRAFIFIRLSKPDWKSQNWELLMLKASSKLFYTKKWKLWSFVFQTS